MMKAYFGVPGRQIHYRDLPAQNETGNRPLLCLAPSPHSSLNYTNVMPLLNENRRVIAVDYPGFGGSDPLNDRPTIETYAQSLRPFIESLGAVDIMGFHSGTLVAVELSHICPELLGDIVMIDVAYFKADVREKYNAMMGGLYPMPNSIDDVTKAFESYYEKNLTYIDQARCYDMWSEYMRAGEGRNAMFGAAFTYNCEEKFASVQKGFQLIATQSSLLEPTREAATVLPQASLSEVLSITKAVFELGKERIAKAILTVLT